MLIFNNIRVTNVITSKPCLPLIKHIPDRIAVESKHNWDHSLVTERNIRGYKTICWTSKLHIRQGKCFKSTE